MEDYKWSRGQKIFYIKVLNKTKGSAAELLRLYFGTVLLSCSEHKKVQPRMTQMSLQLKHLSIIVTNHKDLMMAEEQSGDHQNSPWRQRMSELKSMAIHPILMDQLAKTTGLHVHPQSQELARIANTIRLGGIFDLIWFYMFYKKCKSNIALWFYAALIFLQLWQSFVLNIIL